MSDRGESLRMKRRTGITKGQFTFLSSCLIIGTIGLLVFYWWVGLFDWKDETPGANSSSADVTGGWALLGPIRTRVFPRASATFQTKLPIPITSTTKATTALPVLTATTLAPTGTQTVKPPTPTATLAPSATMTPTASPTPTVTTPPPPPTATPTQTPTPTLTTAPPPTSAGSRGGSIYYVSLSGNDANPGTQQQPWRSIQKAADTALAGDTVFVHEGSYKEVVTFHISGVERTGVTAVRLTDGNRATFPGALNDVLPGDSLYIYYSRHSNNGVYPIVEVGRDYVRVAGAPFIGETQFVQASIATPVRFQVAAGETATLDPRFESNWGPPARVMGASYVILDGFRVTGSQHAGVSFEQSSHHNVFQNGEIFNNWRPGVYVVNASTYNMIVRNSIHNNGTNGPGEGVYIGKSPQDGGPDSTHATHVIGNHIYNIPTGDEGTDVKPGIQNTVIADNLYENCVSDWGVILIGDLTSRSLIYGNVLRNNSGSASWAGAISIYGPDNLTYNNLIVNNSGLDGIYLFQYPGNKVYHNTIYGHDVGIGFDDQGPGISGTEIFNNLLSQNQWQITGKTGNAAVDCNLIDGASRLLGTNYIQAGPLFVNLSAGDFRLIVGSPAINACPDRGLRLDINHLPRPIGGGYDIGAYEYSGG